MAANVERVARYNVELDEPLTNQLVPGLLMQNDKLADTVELAVTRAGAAASLTGCTAFGEFVRPVDGVKVRCPGTISGGTVKIPLKDQCYKYAGAFALVIRCNDGTRERSLMRLSGYVERGGDGVIIDPSGSIPSYADLEQAIANCNAAAEAANGAKADIEEALAAGELTGPQGPTGPTGPTGPQGPTGPTGATPKLTIGTVTTGAAGTNAGATITGTDKAPVLNLVIPRGDTGAVDGIDYYTGSPAALGTASPGTANGVARGNHVHPMPTAGDIPVESGNTATVKSKLDALETTAEAAKTKADAAVRYDEAQNLTDDQRAQARTNIGAAAVANYTATLTASGWTGTAAPYTQEVAAAGILASDMPFVDVNMNGLTTVDDMTAVQDAFGLILKATAGAGKITFVALDKPETDIKVKIKNVRQSSKWGAIRYAVQDGDGPTKYPVGSQLSVHHDEYGTIVFDVVAHDLHKKPDDPTAHTMTLMMHDCINNRQIDAPEMLWANTGKTALAAGTYNFTLYKGGYNGQTGEDGTYQFTLAKPIPAGGGWTHSQVGTPRASTADYKPANIIGAYVTTYDANRNAIETGVAVTAGSGGTALGTASNAKADCVNTVGTFNSVSRRSAGSNNWQQSAVRQWLNSDAAANAWWQKQTFFDLKASYAGSAGFLNGIDADFLSVLGAVDITTAKNTVYEVDATGGSYVTRDKVFCASMTEIGLGNNGGIAEGGVMGLFDGATATDRIKYDIAAQTTARNWWLRSPGRMVSNSTNVIKSDGGLTTNSAYAGNSAAACCVIY